MEYILQTSTLSSLKLSTVDDLEISSYSKIYEDGKEEIFVTLKQDSLKMLTNLDLIGSFDAKDIQSYFNPSVYRNKALEVEWAKGFESKAAAFAPVACLYNIKSKNRLSIAISEVIEPVQINVGVHEENASMAVRFGLFYKSTKPLREYSFSILIDTRDVFYYTSLSEISSWWESMDNLKATPVPKRAYEAMYSTWYSFHQLLDYKSIEAQCEKAVSLGLKSIIVDDGWQTLDNARGYAFCGDWEICTEKMGDMKSHVARVHDMGLKYILWYSVPYIGIYSDAYKVFEDMFLYKEPEAYRGILDPRFPKVREYLINTYVNAVKDWDLDGFKLDFVDRFYYMENHSSDYHKDHDYVSVQEAADRLLSDIITSLKEVKEDILIEFRQDYIGPAMRKYGNMFRVADCPNDSLTNRVGSLDLRLLSGNTAVHSDMIMWNYDEKIESSALQFINILFSVPQFSMDIFKLTDEQVKMSKFWLSYINENSDILLHGQLMPLNPESAYPLVTAVSGDKAIIAVYNNMLIDVPCSFTDLHIVNGAMNSEVAVDFKDLNTNLSVTVLNCLGDVVDEYSITASNIIKFTTPLSGMLIFKLK